jgi:demethylmenaquinone methyltransferase / 2-methoxy-6-polyprenyl-1,4-benzoquinol methylase
LKTLKTPHQKKQSNDSRHESEAETAFFGFHQVPLREKAGYVLRHFNAIAGRYDFMNTVLSFGIHHAWKRLSVNAMDLKAGDRIIDVCGGTADLAILAAGATGQEGRVVLYDINRAMIEQGVPKISKASLDHRIACIQGDAECISFRQNSFDAAMIGFGIRNVTRMERGLSEMYRVLKPGGKLMCLEFSCPTSAWFGPLYDFYSFQLMPLVGRFLAGNPGAYRHLSESIRKFPLPDQFKDMLKNAGFVEVSHRRLTNGIAVIYLGLKL